MISNNGVLFDDELSLAFFASHDLREPLRKISAFSTMIAEDQHSHLSPESGAYLERILISVKRMQQLTDKLFEYSAIDTSKKDFMEVDINQLITAVQENLSETITSKGAALKVSALPVVNGDYELITQLFTYLLHNALLYIGQDSKPSIIVSSSLARENGVDYHKIDIEDMGIGFSPEQALKIFEPFRRLHSKDKYEGSGMSLAICSKIAQLHNGFTTAQGAVGKGAVFSVFIPQK